MVWGRPSQRHRLADLDVATDISDVAVILRDSANSTLPILAEHDQSPVI